MGLINYIVELVIVVKSVSPSPIRWARMMIDKSRADEPAVESLRYIGGVYILWLVANSQLDAKPNFVRHSRDRPVRVVPYGHSFAPGGRAANTTMSTVRLGEMPRPRRRLPGQPVRSVVLLGNCLLACAAM